MAKIVSRLLCGLLLLGGLSACSRLKGGGNWYDSGSGLINLGRVTVIRSEMSFEVIFKKRYRDGSEYFDTVSLVKEKPINRANVDEVIARLAEYKGQWERVSYLGVIHFDHTPVRLPGFEQLGLEDASGPRCLRLLEHWLSTCEELRKQVL